MKIDTLKEGMIGATATRRKCSKNNEKKIHNNQHIKHKTYHELLHEPTHPG